MSGSASLRKAPERRHCRNPLHGRRGGTGSRHRTWRDRRRDCWIGPRIDDGQANSLEIGDVPRNDAGAVNARNRGDHQIDGAYRATGLSTGHEQIGICCSGITVERQNASPKVIREHGAGGFLKRATTTAGWQDTDAGEDLRLADGSGEQLFRRLPNDPISNSLAWCDGHHLGQHVGVEHQHQSKRGGSRAGSRGGSSRSTPPRGAKRARTRS